METNEKLVPVFMPALVLLLEKAEELKAAPLTEEEVLRIRDGAMTVTLPEDVAAGMTESRGYRDVDPENCWADWQNMRAEMQEE